ncbi:hypothetical protein [Pararhizobium haloflavum]|uniref:hypothetical protein n=1 Tax=Pararhizobium haloflavum TaxID=2037914 RepID=UPI0012FFF1FD|nr:hypothetical protein [Pararhizobium haloflavum]
MPERTDTLRSVPDPVDAKPTSRKEDYKAYAERDIDEGWPYSDEPGNEQARLDANRPYAAEDETPVALDGAVEGFHVETAPVGTPTPAPDDAQDDETVRKYIDDQDRHDRGAPGDESADPEVDPEPKHRP